jgi:hypothetical protein
MNTTIILHGYSDESASFKPLAKFLQANGVPVVTIHLGNYVSLEDAVTIPDLAKAFARALTKKKISTAAGSIDLIVHSTGSLVAREWLTRFYLEPGLACPVRHYLMLAPANFGSPLAAMGKTMLGRVLKGWKSGFESGRQVLNALEMGSPYTRDLARRDLFGPRSFYDPAVCMAAVLVGSKPYQAGLRQIVDRNGGDGTVYVCTANLNSSGLTLRFGHANESTVVEEWTRSAKPVAFGVFPDRDHETITRPDQGKKSLGNLVLEFLKLDSAEQYADFSAKCDELTAHTLPPNPDREIYHTYQNLAARVTDDLGHPVKDYFLEFYEHPAKKSDEQKIDRLMIRMHREVLEDVHTYGPDPSCRSLLFDLTDLRKTIAGGKKLMFSLSAAPLSPLISFSAGATNDVSELALHGSQAKTLWRDNQTLIADLVIQRLQAPNVFELRPSE